jgi:hypothetical protein
VKTGFHSSQTLKMGPVISSVLIVLCVFRACFMFMYPNGVFDDKPLAEFVVFEIPTFLLLSVVIICIYFWKNVVRSGFFADSYNLLILALGIPFVWILWIVVTIVYSEAILSLSSFILYLFSDFIFFV